MLTLPMLRAIFVPLFKPGEQERNQPQQNFIDPRYQIGNQKVQNK